MTHALTPSDFAKLPNSDNTGWIEFVSLQDLKGSKYFNPDSYNKKLSEVAYLNWDILIVDGVT